MKTRPLPVPEPRRPLTDTQRLAWLRLIRSENVGPVTFREILNHFGGAEQALIALPDLSRRGGRGRPIRICPAGEAERELAAAKKLGVSLAAIDEEGYPPLLAVIEAPPPLLYIKGRTELLSRPAIAVVGSRDASAAGRKLTQVLAGELGREGFVIVSGLARGIDAAAHVNAMATGTAAVLAGGIDVIYPPENSDLHREIGEQGLLIAESAPGLEPRGKDFPRRNRIIAGMSLGVLVVEAARRSGSRLTAQFALEQGRDVFAVPGNPLDPRAEGTNQLIKDGATLVTTAADILESLSGILGSAREPLTARSDLEIPATSTRPIEVDDGERRRVVEALGAAPVTIDDIIRTTGLDTRHVRAALIELDLAGRIERHAGQRVSLRMVA